MHLDTNSYSNSVSSQGDASHLQMYQLHPTHAGKHTLRKVAMTRLAMSSTTTMCVVSANTLAKPFLTNTANPEMNTSIPLGVAVKNWSASSEPTFTSQTKFSPSTNSNNLS
jgi:hypothetical protein